MQRFHNIFPNGEYEDIWEKLFAMYDYFAVLAEYVAKELKFTFDAEETSRVRTFLEYRRRGMLSC